MFERITPIGGEVNSSAAFVEPVHSQHVEVSLSKLALQFGVRGQRILRIVAVQVELGVAITPTRPQKTVT